VDADQTAAAHAASPEGSSHGSGSGRSSFDDLGSVSRQRPDLVESSGRRRDNGAGERNSGKSFESPGKQRAAMKMNERLRLRSAQAIAGSSGRNEEKGSHGGLTSWLMVEG
jgi:hypothetical protein